MWLGDVGIAISIVLGPPVSTGTSGIPACSGSGGDVGGGIWRDGGGLGSGRSSLCSGEFIPAPGAISTEATVAGDSALPVLPVGWDGCSNFWIGIRLSNTALTADIWLSLSKTVA